MEFILQNNVDLLWSLQKKGYEANFTVDQDDRLTIISKWNLIGRLIKWVKDRNGAVTARVNQKASLRGFLKTQILVVESQELESLGSGSRN